MKSITLKAWPQFHAFSFTCMFPSVRLLKPPGDQLDAVLASTISRKSLQSWIEDQARQVFLPFCQYNHVNLKSRFIARSGSHF